MTAAVDSSTAAVQLTGIMHMPTRRDVDISFDTDGSVDGGVAIHIDNSNTSEELARIPVENCKLLPDTEAKYTSSKRRLTLK
jgi:hypothetical protein